MKNLLSAEFSRLFKNRLFYGLLISAFLFGVGIQLYIYFGSLKYDMVPRIESGFFSIAMLISFVVAVFVSLFIGTEYSDGTLRNKIIHGESRHNIYFSKLDEIQVGKIFDRFYTVENARTSTGLGLSIARSLAERMNGSITASFDSGRFVLIVLFDQQTDSV